jgi:hypothetical protein
VADAAEKGLAQAGLQTATPGSATYTAILRDLRTLDVRWTRLTLSWSTLEPTRGAYDGTALAQLDSQVDDLRAARVKVILTVVSLPQWAQDSYWWNHPPKEIKRGPQGFYPIRDGALKDFSALGRFLAEHFKGRVACLECWNTPNLWTGIYPQRTSDPYFAARKYVKMLAAFHRGVASAGTDVLVLGGVTASNGLNDRMSTSPLRFAKYLKKRGATAWLDAYSHHPETPGGMYHNAPGDLPNNPATTVVLSNLPTLLRVFPTKFFFLTEYGYNTRPCVSYGLFSVSERTQARYLTQAFAQVRHFSQVRVLLWYQLKDSRAVPAKNGLYTGLRRADDTRKPSWFAFKRVGR